MMPCTRPPCLIHLATQPVGLQRGLQRRWARVLDVRFVATQQAKERIEDRYKDKLREKARREGFKDLNQLKEVYGEKIRTLRKQAIVPGATGPLHAAPTQPTAAVSESPWPSPPPVLQPQPHARKETSKNKGIKTLSSFVDVGKAMELSQRDIEVSWRQMHASNERSLCAAIPADTFSSIASTARRHPQFILPGLPREQPDDVLTGDASIYEAAPIHFLQWTFPAPDTITVMFTHLAEYKLRGQYAQPHTTLTHHLELAQAKGLVLCQGLVVPDIGVSMEEGKWLVMCMQKFYNTKTMDEIDAEGGQSHIARELKKSRRRLIEQFNQGDTDFKIEELLDQAERIG